MTKAEINYIKGDVDIDYAMDSLRFFVPEETEDEDEFINLCGVIRRLREVGDKAEDFWIDAKKNPPKDGEVVGVYCFDGITKVTYSSNGVGGGPQFMNRFGNILVGVSHYCRVPEYPKEAKHD